MIVTLTTILGALWVGFAIGFALGGIVEHAATFREARRAAEQSEEGRADDDRHEVD